MTDYDTADEHPAEELRADQLASARARIRTRTIRCQVCGNRRQVTGKGLYCGDLCRTRAYRARKRAAATSSPSDILAELRAALDTCQIKRARRLAETLSTILLPTQES